MGHSAGSYTSICTCMLPEFAERIINNQTMLCHSDRKCNACFILINNDNDNDNK